jgi:hypothetical protein
MNTGMQDMINLGWKLAMVMKGQAKPELLDTYGADRLPVIQNVLTKTEGLTGAIGSESTLFRSVFAHLAPWLVGNEYIQRNSTERMSQLALNYRESPLSVAEGHPGSLRAGDRMPDARLTVLSRQGSLEPNPQPTTMFELLDPSRFTLFYCNIPNPERTHAEIQNAISPWRYLMRGYQIAPAEDEHNTFRSKFGNSASIILVRPDGYIALIGTGNSIPHIAKFCNKWFVPQSSKE